VKVNSDAAFKMSTASSASGVIIGDSDGSLLAAAAKHYNHMADGLTNEFLTARDGLDWQCNGASTESSWRVII
jgi:cysteine synthase